MKVRKIEGIVKEEEEGERKERLEGRGGKGVVRYSQNRIGLRAEKTEERKKGDGKGKLP